MPPRPPGCAADGGLAFTQQGAGKQNRVKMATFEQAICATDVVVQNRGNVRNIKPKGDCEK